VAYTVVLPKSRTVAGYVGNAPREETWVPIWVVTIRITDKGPKGVCQIVWVEEVVKVEVVVVSASVA